MLPCIYAHPVLTAYANLVIQHRTEPCIRHSQSAVLRAFAGIYSKVASCIMCALLLVSSWLSIYADSKICKSWPVTTHKQCDTRTCVEGPHDKMHNSTLQVNCYSTKRNVFVAMNWNKIMNSITDGQKLVL